jgi:hypothetical protein
MLSQKDEVPQKSHSGKLATFSLVGKSHPGEVPGAIEKPNSSETKLCCISAALRQGSNSDNDFVGFLIRRGSDARM